ncbi:hypothetical protein AO398_10570 [Methylobacterium sp. GXS13]|nr:hypothetical protein AO398_10570 [Methylobacterium sp. GXS13]
MRLPSLARRDGTNRSSQVSGDGRKIGCGLSQTVGVQLASAPLRAGSEPAEKAHITRVTRPNRHYRGMSFCIPGNG